MCIDYVTLFNSKKLATYADKYGFNKVDAIIFNIESFPCFVKVFFVML